MSTALATTQSKPSVLKELGARYSVDPDKLLATLKATVFQKASDEQLTALCIVANQYNLNPLTKEIYAFPDKGGGIVPVVGVDGWIRLMNSNPAFDGVEFETEEADGKPVSVTASISVKGRSRPVKVTEYLSECSRNTDPWNKCPRRMLRHKALIQGVRVAFGFSGIYDEDEAQTITAQPEKPVFGTVVEVPKPMLQAPAPTETEQAETPLGQVAQLIYAASITEDDLMTVLRNREIANAKQSLSDLSERKLKAIVADWETITADLKGE